MPNQGHDYSNRRTTSLICDIFVVPHCYFEGFYTWCPCYCAGAGNLDPEVVFVCISSSSAQTVDSVLFRERRLEAIDLASVPRMKRGEQAPAYGLTT